MQSSQRSHALQGLVTALGLCWLSFSATPGGTQAGRGVSPGSADLLRELASKCEVIRSLRALVTTDARTAGGWVTTTQQLSFAAPDSFRLETLTVGDPLAEKLVSLCSGDESYLIPEKTPVVTRWQRNLCRDWGNQPGGPANVALFGTGYERVAAEFAVRLSGGDKVLGRSTERLVLTASDPGRSEVKDFVDTATTKYWTQYAVFRLPHYERPPEIRLLIDRTRGVVLQREHVYDRQVRLRAVATAVTELSPGLDFPVAWEIFNAAGTLVEKVRYSDLELNPNIAPSVFAFAAPAEAVILNEPVPTVPVCAARVQAAPDDASAQFTLAVALVRHQQDFVAALARLASLSQRFPEKPGPQVEAARLLAYAGRVSEAATKLDAVLKSAPDYPLALEYAAATAAAGRTADAAAKLREAAKRLPEAGPLRVALGRLELRLERPEEAAAQFLATLELPGAANASARLDASRLLVLLARWQFDRDWLTGRLAQLPDCAAKHLLEGDSALVFGDDDAALEAYAAAAEAAPEDFLLRRSVGLALLARQHEPEAERHLAAVLQSLPQDPLAHEVAPVLSGYLVSQERFAEALAVLRDTTAALVGQAAPGQLRTAIRETATKLGCFSQLLEYLKGVARDRKKIALPGLRLLAEMQSEVGDLSGAIATYELATRRFGTDAFLVVELAKARIALADQKAEAAGQTGFKNRDYKEAIRELDRVSRSTSRQSYYRQLYVAMLDRWIRQYEASKVLKTMVAENATDSDTFLVQASVRPVAGFTKPGPVIDALQKALELSYAPVGDRYEEMLFGRQLLANALERNNQAAEAAAQFQTVLLSSADPGTRVALRQRAADAYYRTRQLEALTAMADDLRTGNFELDERTALWRKVVQLTSLQTPEASDLASYLQQQFDTQPKNATVAQLVGEIAAAHGDMPGAVAAYVRACEADPADAAGWMRLAELQHNAGQPTESLESVQKAVLAAPYNSRFRRTWALQLAAAGRTEEALAQTKPLMLYSNADHRAFASLADIEGACGKHDEAVFHYRLALRLAQYDPAVTFEETGPLQQKLATALAETGHLKGAVDVLDSLTKPPLPVRQRLAGLFRQAHWAKLGKDPARAREALNQILALTGEGALRAEAEKLLAELGP